MRWEAWGVLNGEGLYSRYEDPYSVLEEIISMDQAEVTEYLQHVYTEPVQDHLIGERVQEIKNTGAIAAIAFTPQTTKKFSPLAVEAGADIICGPIDGYHRSPRFAQLPRIDIL